MARILVTGASGFIGSHLVQAVKANGHDPCALSRRGTDSIRWSLGEPLPPASLSETDWAVHLAHDFNGEHGAFRTVQGTLKVIDELRKAGVKRQIFFSSLSARPDATSLYGKTKFIIEQHIAGAPDVVIVRPGLVLGAGGIYGRIQNWVRRWPVAPLPDGGRGQICVIDVEELCRQTLSVLMIPDSRKEYNLFEPSPVTLRYLIRQESEKMGRHTVIVPVPSRLLLCGLRLAEQIGVELPIKADNLAGFLANQPDFHQQSHAR